MGFFAPPATVGKPLGRRVSFDGDSLTDFGVTSFAESGDTAVSFDSTGFVSWTRAYLGGIIECEPTDVIAVQGSTTADVLGRASVNAAKKYDFVVIHAGTNDCISTPAIPPETSISNLRATYQIYLNAGTRVLAIPVLPRPPGGWGGTAQDTIDRRSRSLAINQWIRGYALLTPGMILADPYAMLMDPADANGDGSSANYYDTVHTKPAGASIIGKTVADALRPYLNVFDPLVLSPSDVWSAINIRGNQLVNGLLSGTGGVRGGTLTTGQIATGWTTAESGVGTISSGTAVWSKVAAASRTDGGYGDQQVLTVTNLVGNSTDLNLRLEQAVNLSSGKYSVGDIIEAMGGISVSAGSKGLVNANIRLVESDGVTALNYRDMKAYDATRLQPSTAFRTVQKAPRFVVRPYAGTGTQRITFRVEFNFDTTVSGGASAVISVDRLSQRKYG